MGRAMMYIASVFSQLERETIAERIRDNMHELAKTGRWLGGITPTGYASECVEKITIDGKTKKSCKLKLVPKEAEIIKLIFQLFKESYSLTNTEAELMQRGIKTKNGNHFTRFALKGILQNPVYLIADEDAYEYFTRKGAELYADKEGFDGTHGMLAYNRSDQEKGRAAIYNPVSEWIVTIGEHPGLIHGKDWIKVQNALEFNKSKSFRRPRKNEALLTGILYCRCGSRMYPKLSRRKTADGKQLYPYVCHLKEHSQRHLCNIKNATGNTLDMAIIEQIKILSDDHSIFLKQMESRRKLCAGTHIPYEEQIADLKIEKSESEKKMESLIDSLIDVDENIVKKQITKRIEILSKDMELLSAKIQEVEELSARFALYDDQFDALQQLLSSFKTNIDEMTIEQKRAAIRTIVRKIIWDGENVHIILFGEPDNEIEYPDISGLYGKDFTDTDDSESLSSFTDVDYDDEDSKALLCEDSK
jgi:site-specific DNA recombinase